MPDTRIEELAEDEGRRLLAEHHLGRGTLTEVLDPGDLGRLRDLPLYPWAPGERSRYLRVRPISVTGRRIAIPAELPFTWWG